MREYALRLLLTGTLTASTTTRWIRRRSRCPRLCRLDFDVVRECERVLNEAAPLVQVSSDRRELLHIRRVEPSHVDDGSAIRSVGLDVEYRDDWRVARCLHCAVDRRGGIGDDRKRRRPQHDAISNSVPA